ncbi:PepSY-associated TM helix domain-containing protein [Sunxiuqinia indica]|uniref:PepSY-associated TM helix domain-containing protein n=1 Tax=Sunxiuqinia indica TaxID=2692584 RepID=UPI001358FDE6|nr:PepSY-associated TM helix domain-containing protein [Sunxiuqinia indica]
MKRKNKLLKLFRKLHKWPGVIIAFLAILFALSGIVMNHRSVVSSIDINRNWLPSDYQYKNWNLAAVRGGLPVDSANFIFYGNIGVWKKNGNTIADFNTGFPEGIDKRKIYKVEKFRNTLFAATHFGLYERKTGSEKWQHIPLPTKETRLTDLFIKQDTLMVMSRHHLLKSVGNHQFEVIQLPRPVDYERKTGLFNTLWELHSGELFGLAGKLFVDLLGLVTILLSVTGLLHFFFPKIAKRRRKKLKDNSKLTATRKLNLRWHNVVGYTFIVFLILNTTAGMFLRPPLLIPIANSKVGLIPGTHLDDPNPWFDKLRRGTWNETLKSYIISTSDGFYLANEGLSQTLKKASAQPPVSVMGCNVLEPLSPTSYLVGSFSGLFIWDLKSQFVLDAFSQKPPQASSGRPISDHLITGYFEFSKNAHYLFDYSLGMQNFENMPNWEMPNEVLQKSPISLWNTALEVHTGRIFEHLFGPFYILYVPLSGLCLIMVLVSGFMIWWKAYRKKRLKKAN